MNVAELAARLQGAIDACAAITPLTDDQAFTVDEAYDVQDAVLDAQLAAGATIAAAKLGLTSRAKQQQMNVDEPLYGWMTDAQQIHAGDAVIAGELIQPRAEPEIAFLTNAELAGPVGMHEVLAATAAVTPAIDILDSRFAGYAFTLADVTADNASSGRFAIGNPVEVGDMNLATIGCVFEKNGELVDTAAGAAVLGHPAASVAWFVNKLAERDRSLPAGSLVLAGALTGAVPIAAGDSVMVSIDRIGTLELAVR